MKQVSPQTILLFITLSILQIQSITSFLSPTLRTNNNFNSISNTNTKLYDGNLEQIEFKIFPDGRIEETVRGIKGGNCHKVTEEINQSLGKVVDSKPTEEMYEQEIVIEQTVSIQNEDGSGSSGGGWDGASSW